MSSQQIVIYCNQTAFELSNNQKKTAVLTGERLFVIIVVSFQYTKTA